MTRTRQGCAIYEDRLVDPCQNFRCGWLKEPSPLADEMRPNRCGAVILFNQKWRHWRVIKAIPAGEKIPDETL